MLKYDSIEELVQAALDAGTLISEVILKDQAEALESTELELYEKMELNYEVMKESILDGQRKDQRSMSGLTGGEGFIMKDYAKKGGGICGTFLSGAMSGLTGGEGYAMKAYSKTADGGLCGTFMTRAIARALAVAGCNASMGRIVAAPTAGSCGILPGCLVSLEEEKGIEPKKLIMSMFTAGAFGMVIAKRASIAGAQGGCQAECGSAAGMAAAALTEVMGGTQKQCADACAIALSSQLGLVCDPVAGLVEIPCIKRNVSGLMIAMSSADMALAGITSEIPVDECIDSMREVGDEMPSSLKETAGGGLAATPTGIKLREKIFGTE